MNKYLIGVAALITYTVAAWFSKGYYHPDEHFQILEFANLKLGKLSSQELPWEYAAGMRSSFQPWIAYLSIKWLSLAGCFNPYFQTFFLRLCTALFAVYSISCFVKANMKSIPGNLGLGYLLLSYFLWFLPFINVRFSSEAWAGLWFLLAVSQIPADRPLTTAEWLKVGIFSGIAFLCRFQAGFMLLGLLGWLIVVKRISRKEVGWLVAMWVIIISIGVILDRLYYGRWVLSVWNYFEANILNGAAASFGTMPWYTFIYQLMTAALFPLGVLVILCLLLVAIEDSKSILIWCVCPLLVCHLIVAHKEVRFLFPVVNFIPLLLIRGVQYSRIYMARVPWVLRVPRVLRNVLGYSFLAIGICANCIALGAAIFLAPSFGRIGLTQFIYDNYPAKQVTIYSLNKEEVNPFVPFTFLRQSFYEMPNVSQKQVDRYENLKKVMFNNDGVTLLVFRKYELDNPVLVNKLDQFQLQELSNGNPDWVLNIAGLYFDDLEKGEYVIYGKKL
jgi:phosphatidylinositol glycan class B